MLTLDEIHKLTHAKNRKHALICSGLYWTGMRASELCNVKLKDLEVDRKANTVLVHNVVGKRGMRRQVALFLPIAVVEECRKLFAGKTYLYERGGRRKFTRQAILLCTYLVGMAELGYQVNPHRFRHSLATHTLQANPAKIRELQTYLGHTSVDTLMRYVHVPSIGPGDIPLPMAPQSPAGHRPRRERKTG